MSTTRETKIPNIPAIRKSGDEGAFFSSTKEALDVAFRRVGDGLDGFVRFRDLRDGGIANVNMSGGRVTTTGRGGGGGNGGTFLTPAEPGTLPIPTGHMNIRTRSVWDGIMIQWDWPVGSIEYAFTEVWAAKLITPPGTLPAFGQAVLVGTAPGNLFVHTNLGLGAVWYYWLRYVGFSPPSNPLAGPPRSLFSPSEVGPGVRGETAADPTYVLDVLQGQIAEDQLALGLGNRIDLVDYYYDETGTKVPVPVVDVLDENGDPTGVTTNAVQNRVLIALRDANSDFQAAIAQEARIRVRDDNSIIASYGVKVDIGGYVSGFGIVATRHPGNGTLTEGPPLYTSGFIVRADKFAIVVPRQPNEPDTLPEKMPFVVGSVNGVSTVGIDGQLVVDGSITARTIQAHTIGANQINAQSVWAELVNANRVFASVFATSNDQNWRVEIEGNNATYPFWYGQGVKGGANSVFFFDRSGNTWLAGNLNVTGAGRFSTSAGATDARVELGGNDGNVFWAGSGARNNANAKLRFTDDGDIFIRGLPLTIPFAGGSGNVFITVIPREGTNSAPVLAMASGVVIEKGNEDDGKKYDVQLWVGNVKLAEYRCELMDEEFLPVSIMGAGVIQAGTHQVRIVLANIQYNGGGGGLVIERTTVAAFQAQVTEG